jgi:hypothetical protein
MLVSRKHYHRVSVELFMDQYLNILIYIALGFLGAWLHYLKKRYKDNETNLGFIAYLGDNSAMTYGTVLAIIATEYGLASISTLHLLTPQELVGAVTAGSTANSFINKGSN